MEESRPTKMDSYDGNVEMNPDAMKCENDLAVTVEVIDDVKRTNTAAADEDDVIEKGRKCGCVKDNLAICFGEDVRAVRDCTCCLKQCTGEICTGIRRIDYRSCLKKTFTLQNVKKKLPIMKWLPKYRFNYLIGDAIAGCTVAVTVLPKCIGAARVARLPPEYGLYSSIIAVFVYVFFGTSKDLNLGPASIIALLVSQFGLSPIEYDPTYAIALTFVTGLLMVVCGFLNFGFIVNYISYPVLEGFTTVAVTMIIIDQIPDWLGLTGIPKGFLEEIYWICKKLPETKIWDFVLGVVTILLLFLFKNLKNLTWVKRKSTSIPERVFKYVIWLFSTATNVVVLILGIVTAYLFHLNGSHPFTLSPEVPSGLPPVKPPSFTVTDGNTTYTAKDMFQTMGIGIVIIPIVEFIQTIAIAKNLARKGNYRIDKNQELLACGFCNAIGSFFASMPVCATFTGCSVNAQSGARSSICGIFTGIVLILVVLFLTPLFQYIPQANLAAVIIVSVTDLTNFTLLVKLWNIKKIDILPWLVTLVSGFCLGIEIGILIGIAVSLCVLMFPSSRPKIQREATESTESLASSESTEYTVLTIGQGLAFPSVEYFVDHITNCVLQGGTCAYRSVILDFVHVASVDYSIIQGLQELVEDFSVLNVRLILCRVRPPVQKVRRKAGIKDLICVKDAEEAICILNNGYHLTEDDDIDSGKRSLFVLSSNCISDDGICLDMDHNSRSSGSDQTSGSHDMEATSSSDTEDANDQSKATEYRF